MCDLSEVIEQLESYGVPKGEAYSLVGRLITVGAACAPYRKETVTVLADVMMERLHRGQSRRDDAA